MRFVASVFLLLALAQPACASLSSRLNLSFPSGRLYDGRSGREVSLKDALAPIRSGSVVIVSENHGFESHHRNQREVLQHLASRGFNISVGMEFFDYTAQPKVDAFLLKQLPEKEFLKAVGWGKTPFADYREQVLFPLAHGGWTVALNAPRSLTGVIAKQGFDVLTTEQWALMPPDFELGRESYRRRFSETMSEHASKEKVKRYFEAQSVWDDTMAWRAVKHLHMHPDEVLVIFVGDFHAMYGGGLPDRLKARGVDSLIVISQINKNDFSSDELAAAVLPHPEWGPRADAVWVEERSKSQFVR